MNLKELKILLKIVASLAPNKVVVECPKKPITYLNIYGKIDALQGRVKVWHSCQSYIEFYVFPKGKDYFFMATIFKAD